MMVIMFWAGLFMALPPIAVGVALVVFVLRQQRAAAQVNSGE
jgi:hypothetical protein